MKVKTVINNCDPERMGRIQVDENDWVHPIAIGKFEHFLVPQPGEEVEIVRINNMDFYVGEN